MSDDEKKVLIAKVLAYQMATKHKVPHPIAYAQQLYSYFLSAAVIILEDI